MQIKLWDWERGWACHQVFEGHAHYVMMVRFNPKDHNSFASASLDRSVKVWGLSATTPNYSLEGHERGVNCVDYYAGGDKPYLISGADDHTLKIWDYQTKACITTLSGHQGNVTSCVFHPRLPVIVSGSEDGTVRIWHNTTYKLETTLNYDWERAWALGVSGDSNKVAIGYDDGVVVVKLGSEAPIVSMDRQGKVVWTEHSIVNNALVRSVGDAHDGDALTLATKELGSIEMYPTMVAHNANGHFVAVCGDGEFVIYTAQQLRNKSFGTALDFVWAATGTGDFAVRESASKIRLYKDFKEVKSFRPTFSAEGLFGGALLAVRAVDFVVFYDWETAAVVRRIDEAPKAVVWSDAGDLCALGLEDSYYVLRYNRDATVAASLATGAEAAAIAETGVENAFSVEAEIQERIRSGQWHGDCLLYVIAARARARSRRDRHLNVAFPCAQVHERERAAELLHRRRGDDARAPGPHALPARVPAQGGPRGAHGQAEAARHLRAAAVAARLPDGRRAAGL